MIIYMRVSVQGTKYITHSLVEKYVELKHLNAELQLSVFDFCR